MYRNLKTQGFHLSNYLPNLNVLVLRSASGHLTGFFV